MPVFELHPQAGCVSTSTARDCSTAGSFSSMTPISYHNVCIVIFFAVRYHSRHKFKTFSSCSLITTPSISRTVWLRRSAFRLRTRRRWDKYILGNNHAGKAQKPSPLHPLSAGSLRVLEAILRQTHNTTNPIAKTANISNNQLKTMRSHWSKFQLSRMILTILLAKNIYRVKKISCYAPVQPTVWLSGGGDCKGCIRQRLTSE